MAMQFMDSTDHYSTFTDIDQKWTFNGGASITNSPPSGRGTQALNLGNQGVAKTLTYQSGWVTGFAVNVSGAISAGPFYKLSAANDTPISQCWIESDGSISLYSGNKSTLIFNTGTGTPAFFMQSFAWYYVEVKSAITGTTPMAVTMNLRVNGIPLGSGSASVGTNASATLIGIAQANYHQYEGPVLSGTAFMRDIYIADLSGSGSVNDFTGDLKIAVVYTTANSTFAGWTAVGSGTGWNTVNPQFPENNGTGTYIVDQGGSGNVANFLWQPVSTFTGGIVAVHFGVYARKDDEGSREFQHTVHGSTQGTMISPGDSYLYYFIALDQDPATGVPWTQSGFDSSSFGVVTTT